MNRNFVERNGFAAGARTVLAFLVVILICGCDGCFPPERLTGTWIGAGSAANERDALILNADGSFVLARKREDFYTPPPNDIGIPGEVAVPGSLRWRVDKQGRWEVDSTKTPWWFDLIAEGNGEVRRNEGLLRYAGPQLLHIGFNRNSPVRPASFEQSELSIWRRPTNEELQAIDSELNPGR
jgi:hypothetical protein